MGDFVHFQTVALSSKLLSTSALLAVGYLIFRLFFSPSARIRKLPRFGNASDASMLEPLKEGYKKHFKNAFTVPDPPHLEPMVILPSRYIDEIKVIPDEKLSFIDYIVKTHEGKYTFFGSTELTVPSVHVIRVDLTRHLSFTLKGLQEESEFAVPLELGDCEEWNPMPAYNKVAHLVGRLSSRSFVGLPLCRNEEWISLTVDFTATVFQSSLAVKKLNRFLRPLTARRLPEVKKPHEQLKYGARLLQPLVEERAQAMKDPNFEKPIDTLQFIIDAVGLDPVTICKMQMTLSMAAIHTTAMAACHILFDVASHPELIQPLREEIEEVLAENKGVFIKSSMAKMRRLDSVMKESQRMNPQSALTLTRVAKQDVTLSDGLFIPKGTMLSIAGIAIQNDPNIYPNPDEYDGFRFVNWRDQPGKEHRYQFVTTSTEFPAFGHGPHSCPGRFFASNEIKILVATILLHYDIKLKPGESRPPNIVHKFGIVPSQTGELMFKKRRA